VTRWKADGTRLWRRSYYDRRYHTAGSFADLVCDARGRVWCAGYVHRSESLSSGLLVKYSADGSRRWVRRWGGGFDKSAGYRVLCLGGGNSVSVAGWTQTDPDNANLIVRTYVR